MIDSQFSQAQVEPPQAQHPVEPTSPLRPLSFDELALVAGGPVIENQPK